MAYNYSYEHHIIPLHEWKRRINPKATRRDKDFNAPNNIVWLTSEQHIQVHQLLWELNNSKFDLMAARLMSKQITDEESFMELCRIGGVMSGLANRGKKYAAWTRERRHSQSERMVGNQNTLGYKHTEEWKQEKSASTVGNQYAKGSKRTLEQSMARKVARPRKEREPHIYKRGPYKKKNLDKLTK
jgi:hypothetical protein